MKHILVSQRVCAVPAYGEFRDALDVRWHSFLAAVGVQLVPMPSNGSASGYIESLGAGGVLLSGGNDLACMVPEEANVRRDRIEEDLLASALVRGLPVIGVCRGAQFLAHSFGSNLERVQDHVGRVHRIVPEGASKTGFVFGSVDWVNSSHNYGITMPPIDCTNLARAEDGTVEAFEHCTHRVLGVLWHPERESPFLERDIGLFRAFWGV